MDEIAQETFLKGFAAEIDQQIHNPERFLKRIAKNLALNHVQKKSNAMGSSIEDIGGEQVLIDEGQVAQDEQFDARRKLSVLAEVIAGLPAAQREAFMMRRYERLQCKQIASRLNVSVSTVEKRIAAAMIAVQSGLLERGMDLTEFGATKSPKVTPIRRGSNARTSTEGA